MEQDTPKPQTFLENTAVRIGTLIGAVVLLFGVIGAVVGFAVSESIWRTNISRDIKDLRTEVSELRTDIREGEEAVFTDRWTASDMRLWVTEFRALNPNCEVPEPDRIRFSRVHGNRVRTPKP